MKTVWCLHRLVSGRIPARIFAWSSASPEILMLDSASCRNQRLQKNPTPHTYASCESNRVAKKTKTLETPHFLCSIVTLSSFKSTKTQEGREKKKPKTIPADLAVKGMHARTSAALFCGLSLQPSRCSCWWNRRQIKPDICCCDTKCYICFKFKFMFICIASLTTKMVSQLFTETRA